MVGQNVGYVRVSSEGQSTARQLEGVALDRVFSDTTSGKTRIRPELEECLTYLRQGDTLHVHSIDRLARNLVDLQEIVDGLVVKGVTVVFHHENLVFKNEDNPMAKLTLQLMGAFAEFERTMVRTRQREGITAAKKEGKHLGRPKPSNEVVHKVKWLKLMGDSVTEIAKKQKISRPTVYKILAVK